ncbi:MAG TPA: cation transporter [Acidimicrobiales bacterium]|nr:cation transporter [Acidimicrobiales bacterium]
MVRAGLYASMASLAWTGTVSAAEITLGITHGVLSLIVFGLAGALDAVGSATLVVHFRHALRHDELADHHERRAALVVNGGLVALGAVTVLESARRLVTATSGEQTTAGVVVAVAAVVVLPALALWKIRIARRVGSHALRADGYLSATGALLAGVAIVGATLGTRDGLWWVDPAAALSIAGVAAAIGAKELRAVLTA